MHTDVKAAYLTSTNTAYAARTRVRGVLLTGTGTVELKDGGASGTSRLTLNNTGTTYVLLPDNGILFATDVHATITSLTAITVFYG
jgi:phage terminase large subunit GpA-like protein